MIINGILKIKFFVPKTFHVGYSTKYVTRITFKFRTGKSYIGFFEPITSMELYLFDVEYLVNVVFPWYDDELLILFKQGVADVGTIELCLGTRIIGQAELYSYELVDE